MATKKIKKANKATYGVVKKALKAKSHPTKSEIRKAQTNIAEKYSRTKSPSGRRKLVKEMETYRKKNSLVNKSTKENAKERVTGALSTFNPLAKSKARTTIRKPTVNEMKKQKLAKRLTKKYKSKKK